MIECGLPILLEIVWKYIYYLDAKSANAGLWPPDLSRTAEHNPSHVGYIYNILTGYHYTPPFGLEVPEGRYFNPYHHHMIVGMARVWNYFKISNYMTVC
jgi:cytochrome c1